MEPMVQTWMKYCEYNGGNYEMINVPAGSFETCKTHVSSDNGDGRLWIGNVPLGMVKLDQMNVDGTSFILALRHYDQQK